MEGSVEERILDAQKATIGDVIPEPTLPGNFSVVGGGDGGNVGGGGKAGDGRGAAASRVCRSGRTVHSLSSGEEDGSAIFKYLHTSDIRSRMHKYETFSSAAEESPLSSSSSSVSSSSSSSTSSGAGKDGNESRGRRAGGATVISARTQAGSVIDDRTSLKQAELAVMFS